MRLLFPLALTALTSVVYATAPLPSADSSFFGVNKTVNVTSQLGSPTEGGGGEFGGTVNNYSTAFWCVDDQLSFYFGAQQNADVIRLSQIGGNPNYVRYGSVTNGSSPDHWTNQAVTFSGDSTATLLPSTATERYEMAAWLVSQYAGFDQGIDSSTSGKAARNNAVQYAIWALTNNTYPYAQNAGASAINTDVSIDTSDGYWIKQALANYSIINPDNWAVVSWGAASNGTLYTGQYWADEPAFQTFLAEVVPEPGFYGVLAAGFTGLLWFKLRKKTHQA